MISKLNKMPLGPTHTTPHKSVSCYVSCTAPLTIPKSMCTTSGNQFLSPAELHKSDRPLLFRHLRATTHVLIIFTILLENLV